MGFRSALWEGLVYFAFKTSDADTIPTVALYVLKAYYYAEN